MSPAEIDDTDLDLLLDMEVLDSRIDAAFNEKRSKGKKSVNRQLFIEDFI